MSVDKHHDCASRRLGTADAQVKALKVITHWLIIADRRRFVQLLTVRVLPSTTSSTSCNAAGAMRLLIVCTYARTVAA